LLVLHRIGSGGLLPDLTLLIEVPPEVAAQRLAARDGEGADRIGGREAAYHAKVAAAFVRFAAAAPQRFVPIDSSGSREETHALVMAALAPLLADGR
jgi:dTMP kinase